MFLGHCYPAKQIRDFQITQNVLYQQNWELISTRNTSRKPKNLVLCQIVSGFIDINCGRTLSHTINTTTDLTISKKKKEEKKRDIYWAGLLLNFLTLHLI